VAQNAKDPARNSNCNSIFSKEKLQESIFSLENIELQLELRAWSFAFWRIGLGLPGWLARVSGPLAGWLSAGLGGWLASVAGWLACWLAGWLADRLAAWPRWLAGRCLAGCLAGCSVPCCLLGCLGYLLGWWAAVWSRLAVDLLLGLLVAWLAGGPGSSS